MQWKSQPVWSLRRCGPLLTIMFGAIGLMASGGSRAACQFMDGTSTTYATVTLPAELVVARDQEAGTVLWDSGWIFGGAPHIKCSLGVFNFEYGYTLPLPPSPRLNKVYDVGIPGVGVKVGWYHAAGTPPASIDGWIVVTSPPTVSVESSMTALFLPNATLRLQLVATGDPVESGTRTFPNPIVRTRYGEVIANEMDFTRVTIKVKALSCQTPDVDVPMGRHAAAAFDGVGSRVGTRDFDINVDACPPGLNSITYSLRSMNGMADPVNGVMNLSADSTADGLGIQITDRYDQPVRFEAERGTLGYDRRSGGSFRIPLRASYYQTGPETVQGGDANAYVELTMRYE